MTGIEAMIIVGIVVMICISISAFGILARRP